MQAEGDKEGTDRPDRPTDIHTATEGKGEREAKHKEAASAQEGEIRAEHKKSTSADTAHGRSSPVVYCTTARTAGQRVNRDAL